MPFADAGDEDVVVAGRAGAVVEVGEHVEVDAEIAVVESVKAASDVYAPIAGEILAVNEALVDAPETINEDPYGEGWFFKIKPDNADDYQGLMDADEYQDSI